ncbi:MAG TPA: glycogen/starch synthase [Candidatus Saccharimonadales bacterium]|nr:glycogen/starch synthase [Candidatus Saccharimonadales bacterium]
MKVLLAASEVAPIIKFGGLGDVVGSLPKALEKIGIDCDVIVPFYPFANTQNLNLYKSLEIEVPFDNQTNLVEVFKTKLPGSEADVFLLKNTKYFNVSKVNPIPDQVSEIEMYTFFSRAVVEYLSTEFNTYDIVHCNDWHTGLLAHLLEDEFGSERPKTLFTVHNLLYQGISGIEVIREAGIVPGEHQILDYDIQDGDLNMMQEGISSADYISTVSPTYAKEILSEEFGKNLAEILRAREGRITGILNGIDYTQFARFNDVVDVQTYKKENKQKLQNKLGLKVSDEPLFCFISRLDPNQKGLDLIEAGINHILDKGGQFVLLGTGDKTWEEKYKAMEASPKAFGKVSMTIGFDLELANMMYAGSDFILIPSKYEPCGLSQMIGMWYGTLPIVHAVGGLKDSVKDAFNGFTFAEYSPDSINEAIDRALKVFYSDSRNLMVSHAFHTDFSWDKSALSYKELYQKILKL